MSWGMNMMSLLKMEVAIPVDEWMFEIWLVNNHGWAGPDKFDYDELQITKCPILYYDPKFKKDLGEKDYDAIRQTWSINHPVMLSIERIEKGDFDDICRDPYYAKEISNINIYKRAIKRFRNLAIFL